MKRIQTEELKKAILNLVNLRLEAKPEGILWNLMLEIERKIEGTLVNALINKREEVDIEKELWHIYNALMKAE